MDPSFQGVNRLVVLSFEDEAQRISEQTILPYDCRNKKL